MAGYNQTILLGRLTADPEVRTTTSGKTVASFTIAVDKFNKDNGANFIDVETWERSAEYAQKYLQKGNQVLVSGSLEQQSWVDKKTQQNRSKLIVSARSIQSVANAKPEITSEGANKLTESIQANDIDMSEIPF